MVVGLVLKLPVVVGLMAVGALEQGRVAEVGVEEVGVEEQEGVGQGLAD